MRAGNELACTGMPRRQIVFCLRDLWAFLQQGSIYSQQHSPVVRLPGPPERSYLERMSDAISARRALILGTAVADAASMGLHWIYAQPRIRHIAGDTPEFAEPNAENYEGVPSYFAHAGRHAGDFSMYGESLLVVLRSVAASGKFDWQHYAQAFQEHFGFGGEYVGYIDTPTRETLTNMIVENRRILERAMEVPFDGPEKAKKAVASKVLGNAQLARGDALREKVEEAIRMTKGGDDQIELAHRMIEVLEGSRSMPGADDVQMPALTKAPVLVAAFPDDADLDSMIEEAVRVTNDNDVAVDWARFVAGLYRWALASDDPRGGLEAEVRRRTAEAPDHIREAMEPVFKRLGDDTKTVTMKVGPACELKSGVPAAIHNLLTSSSYTEAVRRNILACGDSCGRGMVVGGLAGIMYADDSDAGIPEEWIARLTRRGEVEELVSSVVQ